MWISGIVVPARRLAHADPVTVGERGVREERGAVRRRRGLRQRRLFRRRLHQILAQLRALHRVQREAGGIQIRGVDKIVPDL